MKYYFITYQAKDAFDKIFIWNDVIKVSPMEFISKIYSIEKERGNIYFNFVVLNTLEISEDEFYRFCDNC